MKTKLALALACIMTATQASAQSFAVTNAILSQQDGKLDKAREEIDKAIKDEKTGIKAKTWYTRGEIYRDISNSPIPAYKALDANAIQIAYESFKKALELDKGAGTYAVSSKREIDALWGAALNNGVNQYQAKQFPEALKSYETAQAIRPTDTTAFLYAAYAAQETKDYAKMRANYESLFKLNFRKPEYYRQLSYVEKTEFKNEAKSLEYIQEGRKYFPNDKNLALDELNLMFQTGKSSEAKAKLQEAVKLDPTNASLFASLANLFDQEGNDVKRTPAERAEAKKNAVINYTKALEVDPSNFESNFNMGVYHFNQGAEISKKVANMNLNDYNKTGKKLEADAKAHYSRALPFFEKANAAQPNDADAKSSLKKTLMAVGRKAEAEKL